MSRFQNLVRWRLKIKWDIFIVFCHFFGLSKNIFDERSSFEHSGVPFMNISALTHYVSSMNISASCKSSKNTAGGIKKKKKTSQICLSNPVLPCDIMRDSRALYSYPSGSVSSNETENLSVDNCTNPVLLLFSIVICFHSPLKLRPPFTLSVSLITCCKFPFFSFLFSILFCFDRIKSNLAQSSMQ